jgi:hypothetical protein
MTRNGTKSSTNFWCNGKQIMIKAFPTFAVQEE